MTRNADENDHAKLSPDAAFSILGDETRLRILRTLGEATGSLSFSELRERLGRPDSGQFNYHLGELVGHFITETEAGYDLRPAGQRIVESILSGTVTEDPTLGPMQIDRPCPYCGSPTEVDFHQDRLQHYCPACPGTYGVTTLGGGSIDPAERGFLGVLLLPPAGVADRTPEAVLDTAQIWTFFNLVKTANGLCPRCSAPLDTTVGVCTDHDATDGICEACDHRYAVKIGHRCPNCVFDMGGYFADWLLSNFEFVAFLVAHEVNPLAPITEDKRIWMDYDEEVLSVEPFEARFTFTVDDDSLTLTVDDDLSVVDATRSTTSSV